MFWSSFWLNVAFACQVKQKLKGLEDSISNLNTTLLNSSEGTTPSYRKRIFGDLWNGVISVAMVAFLLRCLEATGATAAAEERKKQEHQVHRIGKLCKRCFASITLARLLTYKKHWTTWATRHKELSHSNQESSSRLLFSWLKWKESAEETWSFQSVLARFNAKWLALDMFDMFAMFAWNDHAMSCWRHLLTWCYLCIGVA